MKNYRIRLYMILPILLALVLAFPLLDLIPGLRDAFSPPPSLRSGSDVPDLLFSPDDRDATNASTPLILGIQPTEGGFNPFFAQSGYDAQILSYTQSPLVLLGETGEAVCGPEEACIAYEVRRTEEENGSVVYTFLLKNGIFFSDGHPVDAADVLFTMYVLLDPAYSGPYTLCSLDIDGLSEYRTQYSPEHPSISGIHTEEITDDAGITRSAVSIRLRADDSSAMAAFTFPVAPLHYYAGEESHAKADRVSFFGVEYNSASFMRTLHEKDRAPMGAGPYRIADPAGNTDAGAESFYSDSTFYFAANDRFMLGAPAIRRLWIRELSDTAKTEALLSGAVHAISAGSSSSLATLLAQDIAYSDVASIEATDPGYGFVGINASTVPNRLERVALLSVLDVSKPLAWFGETAQAVNRPMSALCSFYPKDCEPYYAYDESGATALECFQSLGYYEAENGWLCDTDGNAVEYTFCLSSDTVSSPFGSMFRNAQQILTGIGVRTRIQIESDLSSAIQTQHPDVFAAEWVTGTDPDLYPLFYSDLSKNASPYPGFFGLYYLFLSGNSEDRSASLALNDLILHIRAETGKDEIASLYADALEDIMDLGIILPVYQKKTLWLFRNSILNSASLQRADATHPYASPFDRIWTVSLRDTSAPADTTAPVTEPEEPLTAEP